MRMLRIYGAALLFSFCIGDAGNALAHDAPELSGALCGKRISFDSWNNIIRIVFWNKFNEMRRDNIIDDDFWRKNKDIPFAICDNRAIYDTFVAYGRAVIFDYQMVGFLFGQSRALTVGAYRTTGVEQFDIHSYLVKTFVSQNFPAGKGIMEIIEDKSAELGVSKNVFDNWMSDKKYQNREQTIFAQALYFLSMHERCHIALGHDEKLSAINKLPEEAQDIEKQKLELDADRCAIHIINKDEARFSNSPVSFFGAIMTIATQAIVANQPALRSSMSHPSTRARLLAARDQVLAYLAASNSDKKEQFSFVITETARYFDELLKSFDVKKN